MPTKPQRHRVGQTDGRTDDSNTALALRPSRGKNDDSDHAIAIDSRRKERWSHRVKKLASKNYNTNTFAIVFSLMLVSMRGDLCQLAETVDRCCVVSKYWICVGNKSIYIMEVAFN